jgi:hypothetical protein
MIPQTGKVFEDSDKSASSKVRGVLGKDKTRLHLFDNSAILAPKPRAASVDSLLFSMVCPLITNILAGESAAKNVNCPAPRLSVKGTDVPP